MCPIRIIAALALTLGAAPLAAQRAPHVRHFPLRLLDLSIIVRPGAGVSVFAGPSLESEQGWRGAKLMGLRFDPDTLARWTMLAAQALEAPVEAGDSATIRWSPALLPVRGRGGLVLGAGVRGQRVLGDRYLLIADSLKNWRLKVSKTEVAKLLDELREAAAQARRMAGEASDTARLFTEDMLSRTDSLDSPVQIEHQPRPRWSGRVGRVATQYVVDTTGRVEKESFVALLATDPALEREARAVIERSRFKPAVFRGRPVRQLVQQMVTWRDGPPPDSTRRE